MKGLRKIYDEAPPFGKILLILAAIVIAWLIYSVIKKALAPVDPNQSTINSASNELNQLANSGEVTHYTATQMNSFADKLFEAMNGNGTDEEQIKSVFEYMQNKADVLQLIKSFGIREYTDGLFQSDNINLNQWITQELNQDEINEYINDVLKANNVDYKF